jgi:hypothetical protein
MDESGANHCHIALNTPDAEEQWGAVTIQLKSLTCSRQRRRPLRRSAGTRSLSSRSMGVFPGSCERESLVMAVLFGRVRSNQALNDELGAS